MTEPGGGQQEDPMVPFDDRARLRAVLAFPAEVESSASVARRRVAPAENNETVSDDRPTDRTLAWLTDTVRGIVQEDLAPVYTRLDELERRVDKLIDMALADRDNDGLLRAMQGLADDMGALQKSSSPAQTASERTVRETMRSELDRLGALIADARSGRARSPRS